MANHEPVETGHHDEEKGLRNWQDRLLPLMVFMTVGMTVFFLVASMMQLNSLNSAIQKSPKADLSELIRHPTSSADDRADIGLRASIALEVNIINRRHHEANVALMARIWTRYMGFIIGMTLAMVGAAFILGRLSGSSSALSGKMAGLSLNLQSASPGLIMIALGVALMVITITNHPRIDVVDKATFLTPMEGMSNLVAGVPSEASSSDNQPPALPDWPLEKSK